MYTRILAVVGPEPPLDATVEYAIAMAAAHDAALCLLGVLRIPLTTSTPDMLDGSILAFESGLQLQEDMLACAATSARQAGVQTSTVLCWGALPDTILHTAAEAACDVIVVGSPACPGWYRHMGGYLARKVLAQAQQPVLVVTAPPPVVYGASLWSRLLVVHDGTPEADATLDYAVTLAQTNGSALCVLRLQAGYHPIPSLDHAGIAYEVVAASGRGVMPILQAATAHDCEVLVLSAAQRAAWPRFWRRNVGRQLARVTVLPILYVDQCTTWAYTDRMVMSLGEEH